MTQMTQITAKAFATEDTEITEITEITENGKGFGFRGKSSACKRGVFFVPDYNCTPPLQAGLWGSRKCALALSPRFGCPAIAGQFTVTTRPVQAPLLTRR